MVSNFKKRKQTEEQRSSTKYDPFKRDVPNFSSEAEEELFLRSELLELLSESTSRLNETDAAQDRKAFEIMYNETMRFDPGDGEIPQRGLGLRLVEKVLDEIMEFDDVRRAVGLPLLNPDVANDTNDNQSPEAVLLQAHKAALLIAEGDNRKLPTLRVGEGADGSNNNRDFQEYLSTETDGNEPATGTTSSEKDQDNEYDGNDDANKKDNNIAATPPESDQSTSTTVELAESSDILKESQKIENEYAILTGHQLNDSGDSTQSTSNEENRRQSISVRRESTTRRASLSNGGASAIVITRRSSNMLTLNGPLVEESVIEIPYHRPSWTNARLQIDGAALTELQHQLHESQGQGEESNNNHHHNNENTTKEQELETSRRRRSYISTPPPQNHIKVYVIELPIAISLVIGMVFYLIRSIIRKLCKVDYPEKVTDKTIGNGDNKDGKHSNEFHGKPFFILGPLIFITIFSLVRLATQKQQPGELNGYGGRGYGY